MDKATKTKLNKEVSNFNKDEKTRQVLVSGKHKQRNRKKNKDLEVTVIEYTHENGQGYKNIYHKAIRNALYVKKKGYGPLAKEYTEDWRLIEKPY